ncbi:MAG: hypothetical protein JWN30_977 [Bacilli bacterium]|nr:hypothetical protein [Bacilli bacterium]
MSLQGKLERFRSHLIQEAQQSALSENRTQPGTELNIGTSKTLTAAPIRETSVVREIPFQELWTQMEASPFVYEDDYAMIREVSYPITNRHGRYSFAELQEVVGRWNETTTCHPLSAAGRQAHELLFFDTETTGLHGGTGNMIFLLGYSRVETERVVVKQFFLPGPEAEVALYQAFLQDVKDLQNLVTYNGKAFDWPQVKTRHTLIRDEVPELPAFGHYDLLHGARRLWKNRLESCRLSLVEQTMLGIRRTEDTPGYLAPVLYFDYLHERNPSLLQGVLQHNEWDVLSLITLYIHMSRMLLDPRHDCSDEERFEVGRWFEHIGEDHQALLCYEQAARMGGKQQFKAKMALASLYKKDKQWMRAKDMWEQLCEEVSYVPADIYLELAKLYEHQAKDYDKALAYAMQAYDSWQSKGSLLRTRHKQSQKKEREEFSKRIERLQKKCKAEWQTALNW